jgi:hypothetical protein
MKLYCTTWLDDAAPNGEMFAQKWEGTQADTAKTRKWAKAEGMRNVETKEVDVPTSKADLLAWLNERRVRP